LPVALGAKVIDLGKHSGQQFFRRFDRNADLLKLPNLPALPVDLPAHVFDFRADAFELHPAICSLNVLVGKWVLSPSRQPNGWPNF
jgi:hypothetical protein